MRTVCVLLCLLSLAAAASAAEPYFLSHPSLSPDGQTVVFAYAGDIWSVPAAGGTAVRLTGMDGEEQRPRYSPDGRSIAFSSNQAGNADVYVMPAAGGPITRLTWHEADDLVDSWSWDSRTIYFTSGRYNDFTAYAVNAAGGTPRRLMAHYFNTAHAVAEHPQSGAYFFTDSWESFRFANRKRYQGDYNPDIKSWNPKTGEFKVHTTWRGKDYQPTFDRAGTLYFVSDEGNGEFNLYRLAGGKKEALTRFDTSLRMPQASADGRRVVFEKDYQLWIYDVARQESRRLSIEVFRNNPLPLEQEFKVAGKVTAFGVSPDGKKLAFISRGRLFVSDIKGKHVREMPTRAEGRAMEVAWLADNRTLLYNQTVDGWLNWFRIAADGKSKEEELTFDRQSNRALSFNAERTQAVYLSGRNEVRLMDLKDFKSRTLVTDELWGFDNSTPRFSPDGRYVAFTAFRNFEQDILIHSLADGKTINLTNTGVTEAEPFWSPDGKDLYFTANRREPLYPRGGADVRIWRLPLEKFDLAFHSDEFDKLFQNEKAEEKKEDRAAAAKDAPAPPPADAGKPAEVKAPDKPKVTVTLDLIDLLERWKQISPDAGRQFTPYVLQKDADTTVLYLSNHDGEDYNLWKTVIKPFEPPKTEKIAGAAAEELALAEAGGKQYLLVKGDIHELKLDTNKVEKIEVNHSFRRSLADEFPQMFDEVWAGLQENFYDETFHGADWDAVKRRYEAFLPHLTARADLRILLDDLLGELGASHLGFYSTGPEEKPFYGTRTQATGLVFDTDDPYRVQAVAHNSPLDRKDKDVRPGDVLVAVDGVPVDPAVNRESYFVRPSLSAEMTLALRRGDATVEVKVHPERYGSFRQQLYDEWIRTNQAQVDAKGGGRIAYVHMKDMGGQSLEQFYIEMTSEAFQRDALILDLRYNTGGNVHDDILRFLTQRPYTQWKYRGGKLAPQPNFAPAARPIVLLINEQSLSDAEMTAAGFKALKLGPVIGTETYRWLIFTSGRALVDGSYFRLPSWGCYTLDGQDIERHGVAPDIYVQTTVKDRLDGRDPQLDRAIAEILSALK